jgi:predicted nucleotidyltransferase
MTNWTRESITEFLDTHRIILSEMGVRKIGLFGSYVRNEQHQDSDIDLLLVMDNFTFASWMDVWNYLEDNFGCEVDLVPEKDLREELRPTVLAEVRYVEVA